MLPTSDAGEGCERPDGRCGPSPGSLDSPEIMHYITWAPTEQGGRTAWTRTPSSCAGHLPGPPRLAVARRRTPGSGACSSATARWWARARPNRPAAPMPRSRRSAPRGQSTRRHRLRHPRTLLAPRPHASVRRRADRRGRRPGRRRHRGPGPQRARAGHRRACANAGVTVDVGVEAEAAHALLAPYLVHRALGRSFVALKTATSLDGRSRGTRRLVALDHRTLGARRRARAACRLASRDRRSRDRRSPTDRASPRATRVTPSSASRCASCSTRRATSPRKGRSSTVARADARRHHRGRVRASDERVARCGRQGADGFARPGQRRRGSPSPRSSSWPAWVCSRRSSRAAPSSRARCSTPVWSIASSRTSHRRSSAAPAVRQSASPGPRRSPTRRGCGSSASPVLVTTCVSTTRNRHRRGAGLMFTGIVEELGTVQTITPNSGGARIEIAATQVLDDAGHRRVDRGERLLPHGRRAGRRRVRRRRRHRDPEPHRPRRRSKRATPSTSSDRFACRTGWAATWCRDTSTRSARSASARLKRTGRSASSSPPPKRSCATSSRRGRSPSTASA